MITKKVILLLLVISVVVNVGLSMFTMSLYNDNNALNAENTIRSTTIKQLEDSLENEIEVRNEIANSNDVLRWDRGELLYENKLLRNEILRIYEEYNVTDGILK